MAPEPSRQGTRLRLLRGTLYIGTGVLGVATVYEVALRALWASGEGPPLTGWSHLTSAFVQLGAVAVLGLAVLGVALDRAFRGGAGVHHPLGLAMTGACFASAVSLLNLYAFPVRTAAMQSSARSLSGARPLVVGHAGMGTECAANTLACFRQAIALGADALEADVQVTGDGSLVMFHDPVTTRQTGQSHALSDLGLAEVRALDAGWGYTPDGGRSYPLRGKGLRVVTLGELLESIPEVPILLDLKTDSRAMRDALVRFVRDEMRDADLTRVYVKTGDWGLERALRALPRQPEIAMGARRAQLYLALALGLGARAPSVAPTWIDMSERLPFFDALLPRVAARARAEGHLLTVSTVDDPERIRDLLRHPGVAGVVTNRVDLATNAVADATLARAP